MAAFTIPTSRASDYWLYKGRRRANSPGLVDDFLNVANTNNPSIYKYYHCFLILYAGICRVLSSYGLSIKPLRGLEDLNYANADSSIRKALHEVSFSALSMIHSTSAPSQIIREVIDYLRNRYADKLTLSDIAEHVHITPVYLSNLFSKSMNITLTGYIQQLRVEAAKPLLKDLNNSIAGHRMPGWLSGCYILFSSL